MTFEAYCPLYHSQAFYAIPVRVGLLIYECFELFQHIFHLNTKKVAFLVLYKQFQIPWIVVLP